MAKNDVTGKFLTAELIAREALYVLENTRVFTNIVNSNYSGEFAGVGETVNVRIPTSFVGKEFVGQVSRQAVKEKFVPVKLDKIADVSFEVSSKDLTLEVPQFSEQLLAPAVRALNNKIDADIANTAFELTTKNVSGTTKIDDIAKVANYLENKKAPQEGRYLVLSPDHRYTYTLTDNLSKVAYAGTSEALRDALLGRIYTLNTLMSNNLPYSLAETAGTATSYKVKRHSDDGYLVISDLSGATATIAIGDGFVYEGVAYRFTEAGTGSSSSIAKIGYEGAKEFPVANAGTAVSVKVMPKYLSLGLHRDAVTFATRPLDAPVGGANYYIAQGENFSIRVVMDYDSTTKKNQVSLDVLYGVAGLHDELLAKITGNTSA